MNISLAVAYAALAMIGNLVLVLRGRKRKALGGMVVGAVSRTQARDWIYFVLPFGRTRLVRVRGRRVQML